MTIRTESRKALRELLDTITEIDDRWAGPEWNLAGEADVVDAHRALLHLLEAGLVGSFESDPRCPDFRPIVTPSRKLTGDNPDAIYFDAPVSPDHTYRIRGETAGAVYVSVTVEADSADGSMSSRTVGVLNDTSFEVGPQGRFEIGLGGEPAERGWLALPAGASRVTTRHYFEDAERGPRRPPHLTIDCLDPGEPPPRPDDASVSAGIRRVAQFVRSRTLEQPPMASSEPPPFVSLVPNRFPKPVRPGDFGLAAFDAAYAMAPYVIGEGDALVLHARWPRCRCANVCLWTRHMQTYDYRTRPVSRNRAQTVEEPDGSVRIVVAGRDPGVPNWIDTEGRPFGIVFWRYMLPEGEIETPRAEVVPLADLERR